MLTTESVLVRRSLSDLRFDLSGYPEIEVIAHRIQEDGYELLLEGDTGPLNELIIEWQEMQVLIEEGEADERRTHSRVVALADYCSPYRDVHRSDLVA